MTECWQYKYLCKDASLPLHAQDWWWEQSCLGKWWNVLLVEKGKHIEAAIPYQRVSRMRFYAAIPPIHTQYQPIYIAPDASDSVYYRIVQAIDERCRATGIGWWQAQGFYPAPLLKEFERIGFSVEERTTYRIESIPSADELPKLFSQNKRRQLQKAKDMHLEDLSPEDFYQFHKTCLAAKGQKIDYPEEWATRVLTMALERGQGRLLAAKDSEEVLFAAMFLAWDNAYAYYLLPTFHPAGKDSGAMAWLTAQALGVAHDKGLAFDFEGSMTPSIASSYQQFGGQPVTYHRIEKFYNPVLHAAVRLRQRL